MEHWEWFQKLTDETGAGAIYILAPARLFTAAASFLESSVKQQNGNIVRPGY